jgi:hypothetical protein
VAKKKSQEQKPERSFNFKPLAIVVAVTPVWLWLNTLTSGQSDGGIATPDLALLLQTSVTMLVAAVGFWRERKWGFWLYVAGTAGAIALAMLQASAAVTATGAPSRGTLLSVLIPLWLLTLFYRHRHRLK